MRSKLTAIIAMILMAMGLIPPFAFLFKPGVLVFFISYCYKNAENAGEYDN